MVMGAVVHWKPLLCTTSTQAFDKHVPCFCGLEVVFLCHLGRGFLSKNIKLRSARKTLLDFCGDLQVRHFDGVFYADDMFR